MYGTVNSNKSVAWTRAMSRRQNAVSPWLELERPILSCTTRSDERMRISDESNN
jgi:hypothetical protein